MPIALVTMIAASALGAGSLMHEVALGQTSAPSQLPSNALAKMDCPVSASGDTKACLTNPAEPTWLLRPTAKDIHAVYPKQARRQHLKGLVRLDCSVGSDGMLYDCNVADESPMGAGFGAAALALGPKFKMSPSAGGVPVAGWKVLLPITFAL